MRREDREDDAGLGQRLERGRVDGRLRQPHALGLAPEAVHEVAHAPAHLRAPVARVRERQDHVVVGLRERRAVPGEAARALRVGREDRAVDLGLLLLEPGQQRRAEVEAHRGVVVDDRDDAVLAVEDPRVGVGRVALGGDALVPVVVRVRGGLPLDRLQPRVLAGRLVEVAVDADVAFHRYLAAGGGGGVRAHRRLDRRVDLGLRFGLDDVRQRVLRRAGFRKIAPSGGSVSDRLCDRPCAGTASATARPRLPTPLPPYSAASLFRISIQSPAASTPTR